MFHFYTAQNNIEAQLIKNLLDEIKVRCTIQNDKLNQLSGEVPFFQALPSLWLHSLGDVPAATKIKDDFLHRQTNPPDHGEDKTCPHCQSSNPGNFDLCWNCEKDI